VIDILGGDSTFTGKEYTSFYAHVSTSRSKPRSSSSPHRHLSRFTDEDLEMERQVNRRDQHGRDTPDDLCTRSSSRCFGRHRRPPILGTEETVQALQPAADRGATTPNFHPTNLIFCASASEGGADRPFLEKTSRRSPQSGAQRVDRTDAESHVIIPRSASWSRLHLCLDARLSAAVNDAYAARSSHHLGARCRHASSSVSAKRKAGYAVSSYHNGYLHGGVRAVYAACARDLRRV